MFRLFVITVYTIQKGRKGEFPIKVYANVRPKKKERIDKFVKQMYNEDCNCPLMNGKKGKKQDHFI